jgi:hypothetical protein
MKLRAVAALVLPLAFAFSVHASSDAEATPTPTLLDHTLQILHLKHAPGPKNAPQMHHQIELKLDFTPPTISLSQVHEVQATLSLFNRSKKYVDLNFPTSQRIEVLVLDAGGKVVNTWSEDQSFTNDPASVTVNPGERLQYTANVATREMAAGQPYIIQAFFPSYPDLKIEQKVIPQK